jgi:Aspartyl protease
VRVRRISACVGLAVLAAACGPGARVTLLPLEDPRLGWIESGDLFRIRPTSPLEGSAPQAEAFFAAILAVRSSPPGGATQALEAWLAEHPAAPMRYRALGWRLLGDRLQQEMEYSRAATAYESAIEADAAFSEDLQDSVVLARVAARVPPTEVVGPSGTSVPLVTDLAKLKRARVSTGGGAAATMIVDTGAEVNIVAASVAQALGLRALPGEVRVDTPTEAVTGTLVVADRLQVGEMGFSNVLFLSMPDAELTFSEGAYFVDGILGLPVFATAGRMAWSAGGELLALGEAAPRLDESGSPLFWHADGIGLGVGSPEGLQPAFFDSGASRTLFGPAILGYLSEEERAGLTTETRPRTTAAGTSEVTYQRGERITLRVDGSPMVFTDALIVENDDFGVAADVASIGSDVIRRSIEVALDFESMRYRVTPPG